MTALKQRVVSAYVLDVLKVLVLGLWGGGCYGGLQQQRRALTKAAAQELANQRGKG